MNLNKFIRNLKLKFLKYLFKNNSRYEAMLYLSNDEPMIINQHVFIKSNNYELKGINFINSVVNVPNNITGLTMANNTHVGFKDYVTPPNKLEVGNGSWEDARDKYGYYWNNLKDKNKLSLTVYVDSRNRSKIIVGTQKHPFKSISQAIEFAVKLPRNINVEIKVKGDDINE